MNRTSEAAWIAQRTQLWDARVKHKISGRLRKKHVDLAHEIFIGNLEPTSYHAEELRRQYLQNGEWLFELFFLWPEQNPEYWVRYYRQVVAPNRKQGQLRFTDPLFDPQSYGWDEATEREWTLFSLADVWRGRLSDGIEPAIESGYSDLMLLETWLDRIGEWLVGASRASGISIENNSRATRMIEDMLVLLRDSPDYVTSGAYPVSAPSGAWEGYLLNIYLTELARMCFFWREEYEQYRQYFIDCNDTYRVAPLSHIDVIARSDFLKRIREAFENEPRMKDILVLAKDVAFQGYLGRR